MALTEYWNESMITAASTIDWHGNHPLSIIMFALSVLTVCQLVSQMSGRYRAPVFEDDNPHSHSTVTSSVMMGCSFLSISKPLCGPILGALGCVLLVRMMQLCIVWPCGLFSALVICMCDRMMHGFESQVLRAT